VRRIVRLPIVTLRPWDETMMRKIALIAVTSLVALFLLAPNAAEGVSPGLKRIVRQSPEKPLPKSSVDLAAGAQANELELFYDEGPSVYSPADDVPNAEWAVRFTPPQTCSLAYIELATYKEASPYSGPLQILVYADDGTGAPGALIAGPFSITGSGDVTYQQINFPSPIDIGASDFHVAVRIVSSSSPHPTFDDLGGTLRTTYRQAGYEWGEVENLNMVLHAFVRLYGEDVTPPVILHIPHSIAFAGNGSVAVAAKVSDQSGVFNCTLYYSVNDGTWTNAPMSYSSGMYQGGIPAQPAGSAIRYYLRSVDNSAAHNIALLPTGGSVDPFSYVVQPGQELMYDDGLPEVFYIESDVYDGNAFGVVFSPTSFPSIVSYIRVLVDDTASFVLTIQDINSDLSPGEVISGPFVVSADPYSGWAEVYIPEGDRPMVESGHFYVVLYWFPGSPDLPGVATDESSSANRSVWFDNAFGWNVFEGGNWIIRAGIQSTTGVTDLGTSSTPRDWALLQNTPNPFNPSTSIRFALPRGADVTLVVHNILGQPVRRLHSGHLESGEYAIEWDGKSDRGVVVSTGVYFYTLRAGDILETRKMLLLK
jgi:hypothetical protein